MLALLPAWREGLRIVLLQNALGRLRNREAQLEAAEQRQTRPNSEDSRKVRFNLSSRPL